MEDETEQSHKADHNDGSKERAAHEAQRPRQEVLGEAHEAGDTKGGEEGGVQSGPSGSGKDDDELGATWINQVGGG